MPNSMKHIPEAQGSLRGTGALLPGTSRSEALPRFAD